MGESRQERRHRAGVEDAFTDPDLRVSVRHEIATAHLQRLAMTVIALRGKVPKHPTTPLPGAWVSQDGSFDYRPDPGLIERVLLHRALIERESEPRRLVQDEVSILVL